MRGDDVADHGEPFPLARVLSATPANAPACVRDDGRTRSPAIAWFCFRRLRSGSGTYESGCSARNATNSLSFASGASTNWFSTYSDHLADELRLCVQRLVALRDRAR